MSVDGMDVDALRGLAAQLGADVSRLSGLITTVNGIVGETVLLWNGPASVTFEQDWQSRYRPALLAALSTLSDLHAHLVSNLNQQTSASAAEGGWTVGRVPGEVREAWDANQKWGSPIETPLGFLRALAKDEYKAGTKGYDKYSKAWSKLIDLDHDSSFLKYHESSAFRYVHDAIHSSSVLRDVHDASLVEKSGAMLGKTHLASFLGPVGLGFAIADATVNTGEAVVDLKDHRYNSAIQHVGGAVEDAGPVGVLAGGAIRLIAEDYELGGQIEWSQGVPNPFSGGNFQTDWLPSMEEAPLKTIGIVKKAFLG